MIHVHTPTHNVQMFRIRSTFRKICNCASQHNKFAYIKWINDIYVVLTLFCFISFTDNGCARVHSFVICIYCNVCNLSIYRPPVIIIRVQSVSVASLQSATMSAIRKAARASIVLDLARDEPQVLREKARAALSDTVSPHFFVAGFGFEQNLKAALAVVQNVIDRESQESTNAAGGEEALSNHMASEDLTRKHYDMNGAEDSLPSELACLKKNMHSLAMRLVRVLFYDDNFSALRETRIDQNSPISVKWYKGTASSKSETRLGAHVDGNMFTLLWSNCPGLQVLRPDWDSGAPTPEDLMLYGMPLIGTGPRRTYSDRDFVNVEPPQEYGLEELILFTVGRSWFSQTNPLTGNGNNLGATCPVLHRVSFADQVEDRFSLPFLVNFS